MNRCAWARLICDKCGQMDVAHTDKHELFRYCQQCPHCGKKNCIVIYLVGYGMTTRELPFSSEPVDKPGECPFPAQRGRQGSTRGRTLSQERSLHLLDKVPTKKPKAKRHYVRSAGR